jgi:hypothetical protein
MMSDGLIVEATGQVMVWATENYRWHFERNIRRLLPLLGSQNRITDEVEKKMYHQVNAY